MTAFAIAAQKIIPFHLPPYTGIVRMRFLDMTCRGRLSAGLLAVTVGAGIAYIGSLVMIFHLGLAMQRASTAIGAVQQEILKSEIMLQADDVHFAADHKDILDTMEKISSVTYLPRSGVSALAPAGDFRGQ